MKIGEKIQQNFAEIVLCFVIIYLAGAFVPPIAYKAGYTDVAESVHEIYHYFCHQRVERSPFLFGEEGFVNYYSVEELKSKDVLPEYNPYVPDLFAQEIYGHKYYGNEDVGYKTALCIRDIALYVGMIIAGAIYLIRTRINKRIGKINWKLCIALMIPMVVDVALQITGQIFDIPFVTEEYINSIMKRVVTGLIFGTGFGLLIFSNLKESTNLDYNGKESEKSNNKR